MYDLLQQTTPVPRLDLEQTVALLCRTAGPGIEPGFATSLRDNREVEDSDLLGSYPWFPYHPLSYKRVLSATHHSRGWCRPRAEQVQLGSVRMPSGWDSYPVFYAVSLFRVQTGVTVRISSSRKHSFVFTSSSIC